MKDFSKLLLVPQAGSHVSGSRERDGGVSVLSGAAEAPPAARPRCCGDVGCSC